MPTASSIAVSTSSDLAILDGLIGGHELDRKRTAQQITHPVIGGALRSCPHQSPS
jgi:hypothetical protein